MESVDCNGIGVSTLLCSELKPKANRNCEGKIEPWSLQVRGLEKILKQKLTAKDDERLLKVFQCYFYSTDGHWQAFSSSLLIRLSSVVRDQ